MSLTGCVRVCDGVAVCARVCPRLGGGLGLCGVCVLRVVVCGCVIVCGVLAVGCVVVVVAFLSVERCRVVMFA